MPANSSPTWACRIDDRKTKPYSQPAISSGRRMTRGSERGACTTAAPELRPKASRPDSSTAGGGRGGGARGGGGGGAGPAGGGAGGGARGGGARGRAAGV